MPPLVLDGSAGVSGVDGTASNPAIEGTDSNTGIFYPAADTVAIGTGGTERLRVDSSGNVGVGTTSPSSFSTYRYLDLVGGGTSTGGVFQSKTSDGAVANSLYTTGSAGAIGTGTNHPLQFLTNDTERARITSDGNLLLGTTTTTNNLRLNQSLAVVKAGSNTYAGMGITGYAGTNSGIRPLVDINRSRGTTDGSMTAVVSGDILGSLIFRGADGTAFQDAAMISGEVDGTVGSAVMPGRLVFYTSPAGSASVTERARITSGGEFYVGATSSVYGGVIQANAIGTGSTATLKNTEWSTFPLHLWNASTTDNSRFASFATQGTYTERGSIDFNRGATLTRYNTTSDATLKNIIGDSDGQRSLEILSTTRIREYAWKDDEQQKPQIGVIAQELYETYKGAVSVGGDIEKTDEEGNVTTEYRPWGVDKTAFTFHLIAGWQAHEKMIQELKAEIAALKGNA